MGDCFVDGLGFDEVSLYKLYHLVFVGIWHGSVGKPCSSVPLNVAFAFNENGFVTEEIIFK